MQRISPTLSLRGCGGRPLRRRRQPSPAGAYGVVAPSGIKTLAPPFIQALPILDNVPTAYSHEFHAELVYDLCAALVREGLGKPETWHECGESAQVFAQRAIMGSVGELRWNLLKRNVEYHLTVSDVAGRDGDDYGGSTAEVLAEHVLAKGDRMIVWWTPCCRRQMFYVNSEGKAAELNGRVFPQPPLVWRVDGSDLRIRSLIENKRPAAATKLAVAPFWNLSDDGRVCVGTMRHPDTASVKSISDWERGFYESAFTHANVGRLTRHDGGFEGLWSHLADKRRPFPVETLIQLPQTLAQFVRGERG